MVAIAELVVLTVVVLAFLWALRAQAADMRARETAWTEERRELLTRIQAPERIPIPQAASLVEVPEHEPDQYNMVGSILELAESGAE